MLGIPTVLDRLIQQALLQVLQPAFDPTFSDDSFGFRPGRSAHQALDRVREHIASGHRWVVDMDLEKFFDRVNHDVPMSRLARRIDPCISAEAETMRMLTGLLICVASMTLCVTAAHAQVKTLPESAKKWAKAKEECGGNYSYTVEWQSAFGFGHTTTVVVRDNKVVERKYEEFNRSAPLAIGPDGKPVKPKGTSWVEKGKDLGSHKKGAPPKTLDELYAEAEKILAKPLPAHKRLYLRFDANGLLKLCFYVDTRIADDAPQTGVRISNIKLEGKGS